MFQHLPFYFFQGWEYLRFKIVGCRIPAVISRTGRNGLQFAEIVVDAHGLRELNHVAISSSVIWRMASLDEEKCLYVMECSVERYR